MNTKKQIDTLLNEFKNRKFKRGFDRLVKLFKCCPDSDYTLELLYNHLPRLANYFAKGKIDIYPDSWPDSWIVLDSFWRSLANLPIVELFTKTIERCNHGKIKLKEAKQAASFFHKVLRFLYDISPSTIKAIITIILKSSLNREALFFVGNFLLATHTHLKRKDLIKLLAFIEVSTSNIPKIIYNDKKPIRLLRSLYPKLESKINAQINTWKISVLNTVRPTCPHCGQVNCLNANPLPLKAKKHDPVAKIICEECHKYFYVKYSKNNLDTFDNYIGI